MVKFFKLFFIVLFISLPKDSYSQDKQMDLLNSIHIAVNRVSDSMISISNELKDLKKNVEILTQKVIVIESDYTSFKKSDWPQAVAKIEYLNTLSTTLNAEFYNLKNIQIPDIINKTNKLTEKYDTLGIKTNNLDVSQTKTDTSYSIVIAILGAIATALLTLILNKKFGRKENE